MGAEDNVLGPQRLSACHRSLGSRARGGSQPSEGAHVAGPVTSGVDLSASAFVAGTNTKAAQLAVAFEAHDERGALAGGSVFTSADVPRLLDKVGVGGGSPAAAVPVPAE